MQIDFSQEFLGISPKFKFSPHFNVRHIEVREGNVSFYISEVSIVFAGHVFAKINLSGEWSSAEAEGFLRKKIGF